ncbi:hypothetical protein [Lysobacter humi (ex Lee et al. 2017)]
MASEYQEIDSVIAQWVERHSLALYTHVEGHAGTFRNVYLGSAQECAQIWIDPPKDGFVAVHAADVESRNDEPMRMDWHEPVVGLPSVLEQAVMHVHAWFARENHGGQA